MERGTTHPARTAPSAVPWADSSDSRIALAKRLLYGLNVIQHGQHPSGEILSFRRDGKGNYEYCFSPLASACVHEALGCFDPGSIFWQENSLELIPNEAVDWFVDTVASIRQRIRSFLAWQEESIGWWRFFGNGSGIDPDVNTTVCAATALLDSLLGAGPTRCGRYWQVVEKFRSAGGLYYTFFRPGQGGYGWMDELGRPVVGFDRVVNAEVLRYGCLLGMQNQPEMIRLAESLLKEVAQGDLGHGTALYPNPVAFPAAVARICKQFGLTNRGVITDTLAPTLLSMQSPSGDFGGPLYTALGTIALVDVDCTTEPLHRAISAVLRGMHVEGGWQYEDFVVNGFGSPALSTAVSLHALVRGYPLTRGLL